MHLRKLLSSLALAGSLAAASGGCVVEGRARVAEPVAVVEVDQEPPPPRAVVVETRPGFVYIGGRWNWVGGRWVWIDGRYERERPGYLYEQGRWEVRGNRHVWIEGRWRAR
ncbi:MAG TPA: hypothetical protein VLX92_09465 [Kofleriaceae bacterium]|nr:hypothetical protein [Kofleriaceae bacterium]